MGHSGTAGSPDAAKWHPGPQAEVLPNAHHPRLTGHPRTRPEGQLLPHPPSPLRPAQCPASLSPTAQPRASRPRAFGVGMSRERRREALCSDPVPTSRLLSVRRARCRELTYPRTPCVTMLGGGEAGAEPRRLRLHGHFRFHPLGLPPLNLAPFLLYQSPPPAPPASSPLPAAVQAAALSLASGASSLAPPSGLL